MKKLFLLLLLWAAPTLAQAPTITYTPPTPTPASIGAATSGANTDITSLGPNAPTIKAGTSGFQITRQEATPAAPTAALVATGTGNCDNGSHVFAVGVNTNSGHTITSAASAAVTCDASHKQVTVTIPLGTRQFGVSRDIYASKAGTTTPLFLVSTSPVVNDNSTTSYTFNLADASLTATQANVTNTTADNVMTFNSQLNSGAGCFMNNGSDVLDCYDKAGSLRFEFLLGGTGNGNMYIYDGSGNLYAQIGQSDNLLFGNAASNASGIMKLTRLDSTLELYPRNGDFSNATTIGAGTAKNFVIASNLDGVENQQALFTSDGKKATFGLTLTTQATKPTVTSCGTGTVTNNSSDQGGEVTASGATACTVVFNIGFPTAAFCTVSEETAARAIWISAQSTSQFTVSGLTSGDKFTYSCHGI